MKDHEVKLLLAMVFLVTAITLISGTSKEMALLFIIADLLAYILVVLTRILNQKKKQDE